MEENKVKVKIKEYDEIKCKRCGHVMNVEETLQMHDGYRGVCICPECDFSNHVHKVKPNDDDYSVDKHGTRTRKVPKEHKTKKQRRKDNKLFREYNDVNAGDCPQTGI